MTEFSGASQEKEADDKLETLQALQTHQTREIEEVGRGRLKNGEKVRKLQMKGRREVLRAGC